MKRTLSVAIAIAAASAVPSPAGAQRLADASVAYRTARADLLQGPDARPSGHTGARTFTGAIGFITGAVAGGVFAAATTKNAEEEFYAIIGAAVLGGPIGAIIGVAEPRFGSNCSDSERYARAVVGVLVGSGVAVGLGAATGGAGLLIAPLAAGLGGAVAQGRC